VVSYQATSAAFPQNELQFLPRWLRIQRHGHGSKLDRTPKGGNKSGRVRKQNQDTVALPHAALTQGIGGATHQLTDLAVSELFLAMEDSDAISVPLLKMAVDKVLCNVELLGEVHGPGTHQRPDSTSGGSTQRTIHCPVSSRSSRTIPPI